MTIEQTTWSVVDNNLKVIATFDNYDEAVQMVWDNTDSDVISYAFPECELLTF